MIIALLGHSPSAVLALTDILSQLGCQVRPQEDAETEVVLANQPDAAQLAAFKDQYPALPILALADYPVAGADDFAAKPVRAAALVRQMASLVQRQGQSIGPWRFLPGARRLVQADGTTEHLTEKETEILDYLLSAGGTATRDDILADVFGYASSVSTHTVETHIHALRKKLGADLLTTEETGYSL